MPVLLYSAAQFILRIMLYANYFHSLASFVQVIKPPREVSSLTNGMVSDSVRFRINHDDDDSPEYEEEISDSVDELKSVPVPKPRGLPRHSSAPSAIRMSLTNGHHRSEHRSSNESETSYQEEERRSSKDEDGEMRENGDDDEVFQNGGEAHPTPSRSAPAPPNSTSDHQPQRVG